MPDKTADALARILSLSASSSQADHKEALWMRIVAEHTVRYQEFDFLGNAHMQLSTLS
jgi:hypothetical protein